MNKHAIMIMAHNNKELLQLLLSQLDSKYFDIFLHVDIKCDIEQSDVEKCVCKSKLYFYKSKDVRWGDTTLSECEYFLLKKVVETGYNYEFLHLISGVDFPIKSNEQIYAFFHKNLGKEFVHFQSSEFPKKKYKYIKYYRFFLGNYRKHKFVRLFDQISRVIQSLFRINRIKKCKCKYMTGSEWFSISLDLAKYILSKEKEFKKYFKYTHCSDEIFVQTFTYNSDFKNKIFYNGFDDNYEGCMRLIDFEKGDPYTFKMNDIDELLNSKYMFARKFDGKYIDVVKELQRKIKND